MIDAKREKETNNLIYVNVIQFREEEERIFEVMISS